MPFSSIHFLFIFFPLTFLLYFILRKGWWRNLILIIASFVFLWWVDPGHIHVILASVLGNYLFGLLIYHFRKRHKEVFAKIMVWGGVIFNLLILAFYKYFGFVVENTGLSGIPFFQQLQPALPLGISYFTFTGISYLLDISQETIEAESNILRFCSYIVMFPKLLQGPITRFDQVKDTLVKPKIRMQEVYSGIQRLIAGLAKKVLLADTLAIAANKVFESDFHNLGTGVALFGLAAYTFQIFFDFAGYTDMAIGIGQILGFNLPENFNYPYVSKSITEFWRRWHMTLTGWFRTYVFIPLEFKRKKQKFLRQQSNILIVFLLTGLWHGASWNFVFWGGYFGLILAIEASGFGKMLKKLPGFLQHFYALVLITTGWLFFRITSFGEWGAYFRALFGANGWTGTQTLRTLNILFYAPLLVVAALFSTPLFHNLEITAKEKFKFAVVLNDILYILLFLISVAFILSNGFSAFLYAGF